MNEIKIKVTNKVATVTGTPNIVCGNSGYTVKFTFDSEWSGYNTKTARFNYIDGEGKKHIDVVFSGAVCKVPVLINTDRVDIGVYAGDLQTTTGASVICRKSILCEDGANKEPSEDVYNQIMKMYEQKVMEFGSPVDLDYNPVSKNAQSGVAVAEAVSQSTDMIEDYRNLYVGVNWSEKGKTLNNNGEIIDGAVNYIVSDMISVLPNNTYTVNACAIVCFYNSDNGFISATWDKVFTTPPNCYYVKVSVNTAPTSDAGKEKYMLKGEHSARPENVGVVSVPDILINNEHLKNQSVTGEKVAYNTINEDRLSFVNSNRDYFKGVSYDENKSINKYGVISDYTGNFVSDFVQVESNNEYIVTDFDYAHIIGYTDEKIVIDEITHTNGVFTTPNNCEYIRITNLMTRLKTTSIFRSIADKTKPNTFTMNGLLVGMDNLNSDVLGSVKAPLSSILADLIFTTETKKIKLIGDSITHGMGSSDFKQSTDESDFLFNVGKFPQYRNYGVKCWAGMLKTYLEEKFNCTVTNNGTSGATAQQLVDNWDAIVSADDDVIICMIGTNDRGKTLATIYQSIVALYEKAQANNQKIIFMSAPPTSVANETENNFIVHMEDIDNLYNYVNNTLNVGYISIYKHFLNYCREHNIEIDTLLADGLHPNDEGYKLMFEIILENLGFGRKRDYPPATRNEITYSKAGDVIGEGVRTSTNGGKVTKTNNGVAICGYTINSDNKAGYYYVVSKTQDGCVATNIDYVGTVTYDGETYYYAKNSILANINYNNASTLNCWFIGSSTTYADELAVTRLLDYYYCKIDE